MKELMSHERKKTESNVPSVGQNRTTRGSERHMHNCNKGIHVTWISYNICMNMKDTVRFGCGIRSKSIKQERTYTDTCILKYMLAPPRQLKISREIAILRLANQKVGCYKNIRF